MKDIKYIKMGESEIVLSYDSKTKLISVDVCSNLGNINGNVEGSIFGKVRVNIVGGVGGSIYGDIESHIYGNIWGAVRGKVVCVDGNVGKVFGEVVGLKQIESEIKLYNEEQEK